MGRRAKPQERMFSAVLANIPHAIRDFEQEVAYGREQPTCALAGASSAERTMSYPRKLLLTQTVAGTTAAPQSLS